MRRIREHLIVPGYIPIYGYVLLRLSGVESGKPLIGLFPGPADLGAVNPDAVHDHSQLAFFIPRRLTICVVRALSQDHFFERSML